jgi:CheY-like chemotaxis protein
MTPSILVIEDDPNMLALIEETLEDEGFIACGVASGLAAIELSKTRQFDVIISDIRMPGEIDGLGALEYIKKRYAQTRCIVMTGFADEEAPLRAVRIQVDNYLYKPFGLQDVLQAVRSVLQASRERSGYEKILRRLWQTPKSILEGFERSRREAAGRRIEQGRDETLQSFFTLVRSRKLTKGAALLCWDRIEIIEDRYLAWERQPTSFTNEQLGNGADAYLSVRTQMEQMARNNAMGATKSRDSNQVPVPSFYLFYDRILNGLLSFEQVRAAYSLRRLPTGQRERDPELADLYRRLWEREPDARPALLQG